MSWLALQGHALLQALRRLATQPLGTVLTALVIGIALSLPAAGLVLLDNLSRLARGFGGQAEISVFMTPEADDSVRDALQQRLEADPRVRTQRLVPRAEALDALRRDGLADVLDGLGHNPLPDAFVIVPAGTGRALYDALADELADQAGVAHVQLDSAWVQRFQAFLDLGRMVMIALGALLGAALVIVTFNTIRLQILTRRAEIEVARLLGATTPFIRRPLYWLGMLQGALGGLIALGIVQTMSRVLRDPVQTLAQSYGTVFVLDGASPLQMVAIVLFAILLGWLGTAVSVRRHLGAGGVR